MATFKKTTLVGTIRKNKVQLPLKALVSKNREIDSSIFFFKKNATLVSKETKKKRCLLLLSSMHCDDNILHIGSKHISEIHYFYNYNKNGVDVTDQLCQTFSVARRCRRFVCNRLHIALFKLIFVQIFYRWPLG